MNNRIFVALALAVGIAVSPAYAEDFVLHNETDYTIVVFQTNEGNGWSRNWLSRGVRPGTSVPMEFARADGPCQVNFRIKSDDGYLHDMRGNFCKISNLYIHNEDASWD